MAAVIRVKRLLEEPSVDALIVNCKRRKIENDDPGAEDLTAILNFAGTVENQEDFLERIRKPNKAQLEEQFKKHKVDVTAKLREQAQQASKNSRYKVIKFFRSVDPNVAEDSEDAFNCTVYDIETENKDSPAKEKVQYVYDLYYTSSDYLGDENLSEFVSIYPLSNELIYGSLRDNGYNEADSEDDSEDSNAENDWRNDYPDESDHESVNENDMVAAMKRCNLEEDTLSSEDDVYDDACSFDYENDWSDHDLDENDVDRFGEQYAKFKAKTKKFYDKSSENSCHYSDDDESNINEHYY